MALEFVDDRRDRERAKRRLAGASKRSIAFNSPSEATCTRSSSGSPPRWYRRASGSKRSTSASRAAGSPSRR
jgi:hypothetical protein